MEIQSPGWQVAVEAAGVWPAMVMLEGDRRTFLILYHRSDGQDRVLTAGGRTRSFSDINSLNRFLVGPRTSVPDDVHLALEVLSSLAPEGLVIQHVPRMPVEQAQLWIAGDEMLAGEGDVQQLLDTLAFLNDWHESLEEEGTVGPWPDEPAQAAELLAEVVVGHQITSSEAAERLTTRNLRPLLAKEVAELLRWSA